jgi:hypothetical protein
MHGGGMRAQQGRAICLIEDITKMQISHERVESTEFQHDLVIYSCSSPKDKREHIRSQIKQTTPLETIF